MYQLGYALKYCSHFTSALSYGWYLNILLKNTRFLKILCSHHLLLFVVDKFSKPHVVVNGELCSCVSFITLFGSINPFSASCIFIFSQPEPILLIEQIWENLTFNLQKLALFDQFLFSHHQLSYFVCVTVYKEKLVVDNWLALKGLIN